MQAVYMYFRIVKLGLWYLAAHGFTASDKRINTGSSQIQEFTRNCRITCYAMGEQMKRLNRFTTLPVLLDMLKRKELVLLDPSSWDDKNDSEIILEYKRRKNVENFFALCFSRGDETIHHWMTYAPGTSGCCIEFDASRLVALFESTPGVRCGPVDYVKIKDLKGASIEVDNIPFTKRWPYRCDDEYRAIWSGETDQESFGIRFDLSLIRKITISQRMPHPVYETLREYLKEAFKEPEKRISRSTLFENRVWINHFKSA